MLNNSIDCPIIPFNNIIVYFSAGQATPME